MCTILYCARWAYRPVCVREPGTHRSLFEWPECTQPQVLPKYGQGVRRARAAGCSDWVKAESDGCASNLPINPAS